MRQSVSEMSQNWWQDQTHCDHLNTKMPSYPYRNSHYENNMVVSQSYLYNENPYTWKGWLFIETEPWIWHNMAGL